MRAKIAFLILAHDDPKQLSRLCDALGHHNDIFIHLDKRAPLAAFANQKFGDNVKFVQQRIPVFWADISVVQATLVLLEEAVQSESNYLRLVLLSGSCYPIRPVETLHDYFSDTEDHIDMKYVDVLKCRAETVPPSSSDRFLEALISAYKKVHRSTPIFKFLDAGVRRSTASILKPIERRARERFPWLIRYIGPLRARAEPWAISFHEKFPDLVPYVGSQFWSITPECAKMVLQFVRSNPELLGFHKDSWAPDEHFFQTIVGNSSFSVKTDGDLQTGGTNLNNLHAPRVPCATISDVSAILTSGSFFVRKVTSGKSDQLLDYLDEHILHAKRSPNPRER